MTEHLPSGAAILGEIDARNETSLRAAEAVGRRVLATVATPSVPVR